jgi:hypothetical protein
MSSFRFIWALCSALAVLNTLAIVPCDAATTAKELFTNPAFSSGAGDWFLRDASVVPLEQSSGSKQVLLNGVKQGSDSWSHVGTELNPVPKDHELTFSCKLRGTRSGQKLMVNAFAYDSSDHLLKNWSKVISAKNDEWAAFTDTYVAPSNANNLTLWVVNQTAYPAYVSDTSMILGAYQKSESLTAKDSAHSEEAKEKNASKDNDYEYGEQINGWTDYTADKHYEVGIDKTVRHSGAAAAYIKSLGPKPPKEFGNLMQALVPNNYLDQRVKLTAWVKTKLTSGTAQLWMRVDGDWNSEPTKPGTFDNMDDRPIKGDTDWTQYSIVVDIPPGANHVTFGLMLIGTGMIWLDDVNLVKVEKDVPLTGAYSTLTGCGKKEPINMNFEENGQ